MECCLIGYLKSYIEVHLKYWYCYIGIVPLSMGTLIYTVFLIRIIAALINVEIANIVGYIILCTVPTTSLIIPNFQLAKQYGNTKASLCILFILNHGFSVTINIFIVYRLFIK